MFFFFFLWVITMASRERWMGMMCVSLVEMNAMRSMPVEKNTESRVKRNTYL